MKAERPVLITGVGVASSLGEGAGPHLAALRGERGPVVDGASFAPFPVHPLAPVDFAAQIPKKSDLRQMEAWQRLGVHAAGLCLDDAGLKGDAARLGELHLIVAAGGGERDHDVDGAILTDLAGTNDAGALLNERLMGDLRPTLFLAQLSNLLAGNISIVHGVTGASRTFMGEEQAGADALRVARARVASGQDGAILVGGAYSAERRDMLLLLALGGHLLEGSHAPVAERAGRAGGIVTGSASAFLLLESEEGAAARGARPLARLDAVATDAPERAPGSVTLSLGALLRAVDGAGADLAVSAAPGAPALWAEERAALDLNGAPGRRLLAADLAGHALEAAFPLASAFAALALAAGEARVALVTGVAHHRGEGAARLSAVAGGRSP